MTLEELLKKYKKKYPGVPYEIYSLYNAIVSEKNGKLHSYIDAPAGVNLNKNGKIVSEEWYYEDKLHRENDKPAVVYSDGKKFWYYNGRTHRENGKPAVIFPNGRKEYWYHGEEYDPTDTPEKNKKQIEKITAKKSSKQKEREKLLKEFVKEIVK